MPSRVLTHFNVFFQNEALEREKNKLLEIADEFEQLQITHQDYKQR